jgi:ElaB/YqjD/DUF883 family membrane-anchored ribosome-binding protein
MENSVQGSNSTTKVGAMNGRISEIATNAHGVVDRAAAAAGSAVQSATAAIDHAAESGHQAVSKLENKVKPAEQWISEKTDAALAVPKNAIADARQYIVAHPWQSLGFALLAGALLGRRTR